jgi:hypothetical protein
MCGRVASTRYSTQGRGCTVLNLDKPYPHEIFTVVIWGADRAQFGQPEEKYRDKVVRVTGRIRSYRGVPEIVAREPAQIRMEQLETAVGTEGGNSLRLRRFAVESCEQQRQARG